ncbi:TonB-dependent receptor [Acinetobacter rudis]|uniref:TonB-dependent receptor plug domain-containing protein n=1 Tax=Acinetobacter rudis TaxID=632955 RepID=UPI0028100969|nr:TonB-dependent receptor [Acinetobacter rudis]MDQ8953585.1 TonB-dependent receptor [Acinetobacter rudis]
MSSIFQYSTLVSAITLAMCATSTTFAANDQQERVVLPTLVVTASKSAEEIEKVPARMNVIDQQEISQNPAINLSDLLQKEASIFIKQNGGLGQTSELSLRGTKSVHTLLLKDGARINSQNDLAPVYTGFLDTTDIQQIEILKGPASVQYGSDAVGGVIQLISKKPEKTSASLTGIYGENQTYKVIANADLVADNGLYAQIGGQRLESDGTRIFESQSTSDKASFDQKGFNAKVGYFKENKIDSSLAISQNKGTNIFSNDYIRNTAPRQFENQLINAKIAYILNSDFTINARYSNVKDKQNVPVYASHYNTENNEGDINLRWNFTPKQNVLFGVNLLNARYDSNTIQDNKKTIDTTGYYIQHQFKSDRVNTQVGIRLEDNDKFGTHTVGQGAIRYQVLPSTSVYANIGSAFRAPSLNELYSQWGGNTQLKPEESVSYELGLDHYITDNLLTSLSVYRTNLDNLITYTNDINENIQKANFTGGELALKWKKDDWFVSSEYAYVETENKTTGIEIAYRPKNTFTINAGLENPVYGISATLVSRSHSNASNSTNPIRVPGYATIDLNAYWNINPNIKLFSNIQNIGDVQYREVHNNFPSSDWYVNGGRLASAGVTFKY